MYIQGNTDEIQRPAHWNMISRNIIPVLAIFGRLALDFRVSKCFLRGPETLVERKEKLQKEFLAI
jgi:hypothetical protein